MYDAGVLTGRVFFHVEWSTWTTNIMLNFGSNEELQLDHPSRECAGTLCGAGFVILFPETDHQPARRIAERIRVSIVDSPVMTDRGPVSVSIGMGITQVTTATANWVA